MDKIQLSDARFKRVWFISSTWEKGGLLPSSAGPVNEYMSKTFKEVISKRRDGIHVVLYSKETY